MKLKNFLYDSRGNVYLLILIATGLFASLIYVLAKGERTSGQALERETSVLLANQILQYAFHLENTLTNLRFSTRCSLSSLSFENATTSGYANPTATDRCQLFHPAGGAQRWISPPPKSNDGSEWVITGDLRISPSTLPDQRSDITLILMNIHPSVCQALNRQTDHPSATIPLFEQTLSLSPYTGSFSSAPQTITSGKSGCLQESSDLKRLFFYYTLTP